MDKLEHRMDNFENQLDLIRADFSTLKQQVSAVDQKFDIFLALFHSHMPSVPAVSQIVQDSASARPTTPSETLPVSENSPDLPPTPVISKPHPCAWNGTNSKVKAVASRSLPVSPTSNPLAKATAKPTTVPTIKASDPPPPARPKVSQALTPATPHVSQRRTTTSQQLVHNFSRVAEGKQDCDWAWLRHSDLSL